MESDSTSADDTRYPASAAALVKDLFADASDLPPDQREAYLTEHCGTNPDVRRAVEKLLKAHDEAGPFFAQPTGDVLTDRAALGQLIGRYKLLQRIGEGGFGTVYMAEQEQPVRRRVALKIIKLGMDTKAVIARFEAERQALAMMDHPNIARVFDAGATDTGRPYFVMELVQGTRITEYCDRHTLSISDRLRLFAQVCRAVQHAHQKGLIHRDIKPSNVLVSRHDDRPVVKVIDFGIAKATQTRLTEKTLFTEFRQMVGTPEYMSPEQAAGGLDVDTRSDVYSLGVLLYELLAGAPPFDPKELRSKAYAEMQRIIREVEPPRPSTRLSTLAADARISTASERQSDPGRLSRLIRGDLDWIVMRCLEKDRNRRYESANDLAIDIQRHLDDEPVQACPPSVRYRLAKFSRRYRVPLATATAFLVMLVLGVVFSTSLAVRARRAERVAVAQRAVADTRALELRQNVYFSQMILAGNTAEMPNGLGRMHELLSPWQEDQPTLPDLRGWEWYYLEGLCHRELLTLRGHTDEVSMAVWSPDGTRLASCGKDATVRIWDSRTGKNLLTLSGHTAPIRQVAWSPDGTRLASAGKDQTIRVWDAASGEPVRSFAGHTAQIRAVAWSPDGTRLASASDDRTVRTWDSVSGEQLISCTKDPMGAVSVAWSPDGKRLASGGRYATLTIWDSVSGKELRSIRSVENNNIALAWSADGTRVAWGCPWHSSFWIWQVDSDQQPQSMGAHAFGTHWLSFSPDSKMLASTGGDRTIRLWDVATGQMAAEMRGHLGPVVSVNWSPDGRRLASASDDGTIKIWDAKPAMETPTLLQFHSRPPVGGGSVIMAFSPDGKQLAACGDSTDGPGPALVKTCDVASGTEIRRWELHWVDCVAWSHDGRRIAAGGFDHNIVVWDATTGEKLLEFATDPPRNQDGMWGHLVNGLTWNADGTRLISSCNQEGTIKVWDISGGGKELLSFVAHPGGTRSIQLSTDGKRLLSAGSDGAITVWDAATGRRLVNMLGHTQVVRMARWSPDESRVASASYDQTVRIWDDKSGRELRTLRGHTANVLAVDWSPDGMRLASCGMDGIKLWQVDSGNECCAFCSGREVDLVEWSPDGRCIVWPDETGSIHLFDASAGYAAQASPFRAPSAQFSH